MSCECEKFEVIWSCDEIQEFITDSYNELNVDMPLYFYFMPCNCPICNANICGDCD